MGVSLHAEGWRVGLQPEMISPLCFCRFGAMLSDRPGLGQAGWGQQPLGAVAPKALSPQRAAVAVAAKGSRYAPWQRRAGSSVPHTPDRHFRRSPHRPPNTSARGGGTPLWCHPPPGTQRGRGTLSDPSPRAAAGCEVPLEHQALGPRLSAAFIGSGNKSEILLSAAFVGAGIRAGSGRLR